MLEAPVPEPEQQDPMPPATGKEADFTKLIRLAKHQHEWLCQLKQHYSRVYGEELPLTWLLYKVIEDHLVDPKAREPRYPLLDSLAQQRPKGLPVGHLFSDLETFMVMTNNKKIQER